MDYDALDPGIRNTVRSLRDAGFTTTDSGDGYSKPADWFESGDALPYPHVASTTNPSILLSDADRMQDLLGSSWRIQACYDPIDKSAILFAYKDALNVFKVSAEDQETIANAITNPPEPSESLRRAFLKHDDLFSSMGRRLDSTY